MHQTMWLILHAFIRNVMIYKKRSDPVTFYKTLNFGVSLHSLQCTRRL